MLPTSHSATLTQASNQPHHIRLTNAVVEHRTANRENNAAVGHDAILGAQGFCRKRIGLRLPGTSRSALNLHLAIELPQKRAKSAKTSAPFTLFSQDCASSDR